jgi:breast cancer 2 susceptibility protein
MKQMRYRYDREIEAAERPALRKICERDDLSSRRLVLCVSAVYPDPSPSSEGGGASSEQHYDPPSVLVTDGWYSLPAILDPPLKYMVRCGRIAVGTKVITHGAELVGPSDPCHPLEAPPDLCLRLSANATRRTRWFTRLGYQACPHPFHIPLASVFSDGGTVGCTEAVIARVYPLIYMEKADDGRNVFRNSRTEERASQLWQELRQRKIEAISSRIQQDFEEEIACQEQSCGSWRRSHRLNTLQVKQLQDGQAIHSALKNSPDPQAFQEVLSAMQLALLESYQQSLVDSRQTELRHRIEQAVRREEEEGRLTRVRTSLPLLRVRWVGIF